MGNAILNYYTGTSGLVLPVPNKLFFPDAFKDRSRISYYASLTNSIEINSSFYKVPRRSTVEKWQQEVPAHFRFTFKLFRGITHQKDLLYDPGLIPSFFDVLAGVADKRGALLVQLPASIRMAHYARLKVLLCALRDHDPGRHWKIALEVRHPSLYAGEVYELLDELNMAMVIHDKKRAEAPLRENKTDFIYLRLHGPDGHYGGSYSDAVLYEYAGYIKEWIAGGKTVFVYFNNTLGQAFANRRTLQEYVSENSI